MAGARAGAPGREEGRHEEARIGGAATLHTKGLDRGMAIARAQPRREFLRPDSHRDIAAERGFVARHAADFHSRHVRDFNAHELAVWRDGRWHNEWHYGRRGWWWQTDGVWYGYAEPIFPYPDEVAELTVYTTPFVDGRDVSVQEGLPPDAAQPGAAADAAQEGMPIAAADAPAIPPLPPAPAGWYRCDAPSGYYPGLQSCGVSWNLVQDAPSLGEQ